MEQNILHDPEHSCYSPTFWKDQGCFTAFQKGGSPVDSTMDGWVIWWFLTLQHYHLLMAVSHRLHFLLQHPDSCYPCEWENIYKYQLSTTGFTIENKDVSKYCLKRFLFLIWLLPEFYCTSKHRLHFLLYFPAVNIPIVGNDNRERKFFISIIDLSFLFLIFHSPEFILSHFTGRVSLCNIQVLLTTPL